MSNKRGRSLAEVMTPIDDGLSKPAGHAEEQIRETPFAVDRPPIVPVNILLTPQDRKRLKQLSLDSGLSLQKLGHEAWNMLLESRGLSPLEPVSASVPSGRLRRSVR